MSSLNRIILVGRLTAEPDVKVTTTGVSLCKFSLAVERESTAGHTPAVDFINVVAWRDLAEQVKNTCKKGSLVLVDGRISTNSFDDPNGGPRRYTTEVDAKIVKPMGASSAQSEPSSLENFPTDDFSLQSRPGSAVSENDFNFTDPFETGELEPTVSDTENLPF